MNDLIKGFEAIPILFDFAQNSELMKQIIIIQNRIRNGR